MALKH